MLKLADRCPDHPSRVRGGGGWMAEAQSAAEGRVASGGPSGPVRASSPPAVSGTARARLLDTGLELFGTVGYEETTVQDLCRQAHVSTRDFYRQVGDRITLFRLIFEREVERNYEVVKAALLDAPPVVEVVARRWMAAWLGSMVDEPRRYRVMYIEAHGVDRGLDERRRELLRNILQFAIVQLRRCAEARGAEPDALFDLAAMAVAAATREMLQQYMEGALAEFEPGDIVEMFTRLAVLAEAHWPESDAGEDG